MFIAEVACAFLLNNRGLIVLNLGVLLSKYPRVVCEILKGDLDYGTPI